MCAEGSCKILSELSSLRLKVAAAEGMKEALTNLVSAMEPYSGTTVMLRSEAAIAAIAAWRNMQQVYLLNTPSGTSGADSRNRSTF